MNYFIFKNTTIEPFFSTKEYSFSQYNDISEIPENADAYIWFYLVPYRVEQKLLSEEIELYYNNIVFILNQIPDNKDLYIFTLSDYLNVQAITGDYKLIDSIYNFNSKVIELMNAHLNVKVINFSDFIGKYSNEQLIDWKYFYISQTQLNLKLVPDFKKWFEKQIQSIHSFRKKCIIIDLDNTIWGGILGEDGLFNIQIGNSYPGSAFLDFQKSLIQLVENGIILAICSKNNEEDVLEVWEKNTNNLIINKYISAYRINWQNKAKNVTELIGELNIGADSIVFIDDNPTERELVKQFHPAIEVPEFPSQPYMLPAFIKDIIEKYFRIYFPTKEDKNKTQQYKANTERERFARSFSDITEYIASLGIHLQLFKANLLTIPRIVQMTQKTNQFNLTTRRYDTNQINRFIERGDKIYCIGVKDKFGDNGVTGLIIVNINKERYSATIDTLLLSCRILGKGIEEAFCYTVFNKLKEENVKMLYSEYIPSPKNKQVENFYEKLGFNLLNISNDGQKKYELDLKTNEFNVKQYYQIMED